ncbi:heme lyase NrfEFG subunit NrfF [Volucribacter amazonae]|nr:heme lyase NrfEFG subunit NrfF [Volucribacter amazonae]
MKYKLLIILGLLLSFTVQAEMVDTFQFSSPEQRIRAVALAKSLRCPQCQNQNLVESNSPIAYDLRLEVYRMIEEGKSNQQIIQLMTDRFGLFVLYKPPLQWNTLLLWGLPLLLLVGGLMMMIFHIRRKSATTYSSLTPQQQQALAQLLAHKDKQ